jgi:hypothetical protein
MRVLPALPKRDCLQQANLCTEKAPKKEISLTLVKGYRDYNRFRKAYLDYENKLGR